MLPDPLNETWLLREEIRTLEERLEALERSVQELTAEMYVLRRNQILGPF